MIETRRLKNFVIFFQTILSLVLSRKIISYIGTKIQVKFVGSCLKQDKIAFTHGKRVNIYNIYEISVSDSDNNYPTLENCLFENYF